MDVKPASGCFSINLSISFTNSSGKLRFLYFGFDITCDTLSKSLLNNSLYPYMIDAETFYNTFMHGCMRGNGLQKRITPNRVCGRNRTEKAQVDVNRRIRTPRRLLLHENIQRHTWTNPEGGHSPWVIYRRTTTSSWSSSANRGTATIQTDYTRSTWECLSWTTNTSGHLPQSQRACWRYPLNDFW